MPLSNVAPVKYQQLLTAKAIRISAQFSQFDPPALEVFESPELHFRVRAEFKIWHDGDDSFYAMFNKEQPKQPVRIDHFPIGAKIINRVMIELMSIIKNSTLLRHRLFQVEFLSTLSQQILVSLIYHKSLDDEWQQLAEKLQERLGVYIIGRSKKQRLVLSQDFVTETLIVNGQHYNFQQVENSFTQPNACVNQKMLSWASNNAKNLTGDLVELYCGNGNFTCILAQHFDKVLATEISKTSVKSAKYNFSLNHIENIQVVRMSSEDFSSALAGERVFRRLKDIDLNDYNFSTVLVDPPRAGLDKLTEELISRFDNILYISCNPNTLYENLQHICLTHEIKQFAIFDQFPYTDHIECGVMLVKRQSRSE
jgi:tRNA (uracil-5-)-methyltransferase